MNTGHVSDQNLKKKKKTCHKVTINLEINKFRLSNQTSNKFFMCGPDHLCRVQFQYSLVAMHYTPLNLQ